MKRVLGVLLIAVLSACAAAQTQLVPVTALEFAPNIPLPGGSYRAFLPWCDGSDTAVSSTDRCYYLGAPMEDSLAIITSWLVVRGYELLLEQPRLNAGAATVQQMWRLGDAEGELVRGLALDYSHINGEVLLEVSVYLP